MTVPFPVRDRGFCGEVINIISLKIRLKAGAFLLASSMTGLCIDWFTVNKTSRIQRHTTICF